MHWKLHAAYQALLDRTPRGRDLRYILQRWVLGTFPIDDDRLAREVEYAKQHLSAVGTVEKALEFGAGRHLTVAVCLALEGVEVLATDVTALMRPELVRDIAGRLDSPLLERLRVADDVERALRDIGVTYRVLPPSSFPDVDDDSIDLVFSTSVLEHVPEAQLAELLAESRRVLTLGGALSLVVDYTDHYRYADSRVGAFNFLAIDEETWSRRYSPASHYQNRLRHDDILRLLDTAGFTVEAQRVTHPTDDDLAWLSAVELELPFAGRAPQDLGVRAAHIVARA